VATTPFAPSCLRLCLSGQLLQRSLFAAVDAILGAITRHTHTEM